MVKRAHPKGQQSTPSSRPAAARFASNAPSVSLVEMVKGIKVVKVVEMVKVVKVVKAVNRMCVYIYI